jgi:hypothetical protein
MLDPQRFTRGVSVRPEELEPVMVRRLKSDLRELGEAFPKRNVEPILLGGLPADAPELVLARMLSANGATRAQRLARGTAGAVVRGRLAFAGLQQRLLSSVAAFAATLRVHRNGLTKSARGAVEAAEAFVTGAPGRDDEAEDEAQALEEIEREEQAATYAATAAGLVGADQRELAAELAHVDAMLAIADAARERPDARVAWLAAWVRANMAPAGAWNSRRLVLFTEWETTRRWLERRLREALADLQLDTLAGPRIAVFTGATTQDRREALKRAFNADPDVEPLRILICTDAAREGINLQSRCHDLIHVDLPWNPARLEQRNGRIDRKLQPSPEVWCRYFLFEQREEDIVLAALVRKTERISRDLGAAGLVIADRVEERLKRRGILDAPQLARDVEDEADDDRVGRARADMGDATDERMARLRAEVDELRAVREASRLRVGVGRRRVAGDRGRRDRPRRGRPHRHAPGARGRGGPVQRGSRGGALRPARLGGRAGRVAGPSPRAPRTAKGLARRNAGARRLVRAAIAAGRHRGSGRRTVAPGAPAGQAAAVPLPRSRLPIRSATRMRDRRTGRPAALGAAGPSRAVWPGGDTAA